LHLDAHHLINFKIHEGSFIPGSGRSFYTIPEFLDFREHDHAFTDMNAGFGGFGNTKILYATGHGTIEFNGSYQSANTFEFFGLSPLLGRLPTHEIGIRIALGAQKGNILAMVLCNGLTLIVTGIILGVLASLALTRFIANQLSNVKATDPWTFAIVAVIILAVGLAACFFPARRAAHVDPFVAPRYE
jgi:uncharacterized membrane protein YqjE